MNAYRYTSSETAARVLASGFWDETGRYLTDEEHSGVWIADRPMRGGGDPVLELEPGRAVLRLEVDEGLVADFEWIEEGKGYREWLVPAALLNAHARVRLATAEEIDARVRVTAP